jgi:dTDP-glucose 4,6-dehydratase
MKILITGVAGFIGSNLVEHVRNSTDLQIVGVDKLSYASNPAISDVIVHQDDWCFYEADICDEDAIAGIFQNEQPHAVIHLAAETHVDRSIDGPDSFIQSNIYGTYCLLKVTRQFYEQLDDAKRSAFVFLHCSTDEVFGSLGPTDPAFNESSTYQPTSPYSASKAASDHLVRAWNETYGLPSLITNCSNNYGPWQFPDKLIPLVINKALRMQPIPVYGTGENIRDWLHVKDHAEALLNVLTHGKRGDRYNIGGNCEVSNIELVKLICDIMDRVCPIDQNHHADSDGSLKSYAQLISFVADRPGHDFRYAIDTTKISGELGWQPQRKLASELENTVRWYIENQGWCQSVLSSNYQLQRLGSGSNNPADSDEAKQVEDD